MRVKILPNEVPDPPSRLPLPCNQVRGVPVVGTEADGFEPAAARSLGLCCEVSFGRVRELVCGRAQQRFCILPPSCVDRFTMVATTEPVVQLLRPARGIVVQAVVTNGRVVNRLDPIRGYVPKQVNHLLPQL